MRYSDDLRRKLIEAWESNRDTQRELADQFGVSLGWVEKVLRRWHDTGHSEALEFRPGPRPLLSPTRLEKLVLQHPDATLAELGCRLQVSGATVCRALQRMDLPRKKVATRQRARYAAGRAAPCPLAPDVPGFGPAPIDICGRKRR
jgi:transposase